ncbi:unnamed protein product [Hydatigera taeniaeformis]|uniref:Protein kinase domain-containing protein n=1 Tax=Hydatigena taeniaeformis TaxID=6205 RepID=A0A3P7GUB4_HYDTA|nr:unnamed protein product [Hydatigera taeniaeformis]
MLPMLLPDIPTTSGFPKEVKTVLWTLSTVIVLIVVVAVTFALRMRNRARRYLHYQVRWSGVFAGASVEWRWDEGYAAQSLTFIRALLVAFVVPLALPTTELPVTRQSSATAPLCGCRWADEQTVTPTHRLPSGWQYTMGPRLSVASSLFRLRGSGRLGRTPCGLRGTYGTQPVAVKRILRRVELEKSWLREHRILMNHHHEHLIRCFWTVRLSHL